MQQVDLEILMMRILRKGCLDKYELLKGLNIINEEVVYHGIDAAVDLH